MVHLIISGNVQGVGFRQFVKHHAKKLKISGWVTNLPNGNVETLLDGNMESLQEMIKLCKKGPPLSHVENVNIEYRDGALNSDLFEIIK